ncbi:MAG: ABC transporter substrate-binding protein [Elainellaceae cyanobacterium]
MIKHYARLIDDMPKLGRGVAIALLALAAACQSAEDATDASPEGGSQDSASQSGAAAGPLKIGTLLPITGDLAQYGGPMEDSANLLRDTVNACGGVLGQSVELISEDTQTEPSAGASAMSKLVEADQVGGVVGAAASSISSAAVDIAVRNSVVQISPASTSPVFTERAKTGDFNGYWFRTAPPDTFQGDALARLASDRGFDRVAVLAINNDYGNGLVASFSSAFEAQGGTVANSANPTLYTPDAATFDSEVSEAFSGSPDAVLLVAYPETGSLILKSAFEQGLLEGGTQVMLTDGMKDDAIAELVGKTASGDYIISGVFGTAPSSEGPALERFTQIYQDAFDREPSVFDPNTWDAAALIALAAEAAQSTAGPDIQTSISEVANAPGQPVSDVCEGLALLRDGEDIDYQGASGVVDLDEQGDVVGSYDVWSIDEEGALVIEDTVTIGG